MNRLLAALCRHFGLRWKCLPMARRNASPYGPTAPFRVERREDGYQYILPRASR